jgi:hypothetical protein
VRAFLVAILISSFLIHCLVHFRSASLIRGWLWGFWTKLLLHDWVVSPMPTPNLEDQGISLSLDPTLWPFRHGWPRW